jgi:hypothetical protein
VGAGTKAFFIAHLSRTGTSKLFFFWGKASKESGRPGQMGDEKHQPAAARAWLAASQRFSSTC